MMCTPRDDPMDLGPFLQEYVLRNPFENLPNGVPPGIAAKQSGPSKPLKKLSPRPKPEPAPLSPPTLVPLPPPGGHVSPTVVPPSGEVMRQIKTEPDEEGVPSGGIGDIKQECEPPSENSEHALEESSPEEALVDTLEEACAEGPDLTNENDEENEADSTVSDTPKGHVGSNITYAANLRDLRLPNKHVKVKKWLTTHYKHVSTHPGWLGSDVLLKHTKCTFHDMKSSVLSRIMKFTFPECRKVVNKYGYFYAGLLARPDSLDLKNLSLMLAAALVDEGQMTMSRAAEQFGCAVNQIGAVIAWGKLKKLSALEREMVEKEIESGKKKVPSSVSNKLRFQLRLNAQARQNVTSPEKNDAVTSPTAATSATSPMTSAVTSPMTSPVTRNKRKAQSDPSYNPSGVKQRILESAGVTPSEGIASSRNRRKRGRPPKFRESCAAQDAVDDDDDTVDNEDDNEHVTSHLTEGDDYMTSQSSPVMSEGQNEAVDSETSGVVVKEEPVDPGYENALTLCMVSPTSAEKSKLAQESQEISLKNSRKLSVRRTKGSATKDAIKSRGESNGRTSPLDGLTGSTSGNTSGVTTAGHSATGAPVGQTLNNVVDLLSVRRDLSATCSKLAEAQADNIALEGRLANAHKEIAQLKDELQIRESQITNLANSFSDLSNQFVAASREFKRVMQSIQPTVGGFELDELSDEL